MSTQRVSSVKIPVFDKENYGLWKKKMMLFLQVANPKYLGVLKNGPKIPMVIVAESIENNIVVSAARTYPKDPADYTADEKEDASLDINLQLILVESLDPIMYNHVVNCKDAKHIWEKQLRQLMKGLRRSERIDLRSLHLNMNISNLHQVKVSQRYLKGTTS